MTAVAPEPEPVLTVHRVVTAAGQHQIVALFPIAIGQSPGLQTALVWTVAETTNIGTEGRTERQLVELLGPEEKRTTRFFALPMPAGT